MGELAVAGVEASASSTSEVYPSASQGEVSAASAASDESTSSDKGAATGEDSTSNEGAATDKGTTHEIFISQRRPERLRSSTSSGPMATHTSIIIKAYPLPRGWLRDSRHRDG